MTILERNQRLQDRRRFSISTMSAVRYNRLHRRQCMNKNPDVLLLQRQASLSLSTSITTTTTTMNSSTRNIVTSSSSSSSSLRKLFWKLQRSTTNRNRYQQQQHLRYDHGRRRSSISNRNYSRRRHSSRSNNNIIRNNIGNSSNDDIIEEEEEDDHDSDHKLLVIDETTFAIIQLEIQNLFISYTNNNIPILPITIVNALIGSRNVINSYANDDNDNNDSDVLNNDLSVSLKRRYDLIHVLNRLQNHVASMNHPKPIVSLDDAMNLLSSIFQFPTTTSYCYNNNNNNNKDSTTNLLHFTKDLSKVNHNNIDDSTGNNATTTDVSLPTSTSSSQLQLYKNNKNNNTNVDHFIQRLRDIRIEEMKLSSPMFIVPYQSQQKWLEIANTTLSKLHIDDDEKEKDEVSKVKPLFRELTIDEKQRIHDTMTIDPNIGHNGTDIIVRTEDDTDSVQRMNLCTLLPYSWVNDEVIHYFLYLLQKRDEVLCTTNNKQRKRTHFFKSFFMTKLLNEGNSDPNLDGIYTYNNVKRWSKKVPGKDIFNLNKIIFPINQHNQHWTIAVIFMQEQKIQYYDSLGGNGKHYLHTLLRYLQDEHMDKKRIPMPSPELWTLVPCTDDTPRQLNGYDCGVFTCMFADFISIDRSFDGFDANRDMLLYREHIALSIIDRQIVS